jgi:uncharacterized protein with ATP-grasp and redox domains
MPSQSAAAAWVIATIPTMTTRLTTLPLLADPANYHPNTVDMTGDLEAREYWLNVFADHLPSMVRHAIRSEGNTPEARARIERMAEVFSGQIERMRAEPEAFGPISIMNICRLRERAMRAEGITDPYDYVKQDENDKALQLLPALLEELDAIDEGERLETLVRGVFAGNMFDLGAVSTNDMFDAGQLDFRAVRAKVKDRPWLFDGLDALQPRWDAGYRKAVVFVDNAGSDIVMGMLPLVRELLRQGTTVVVTANTAPALNDITHDELVPLIERIAGFDSVFADAARNGQLQLVPSGNDAPLIYMNQISPELAAACDGADLIIIEGMGRAVETNLNTAFTVDALKLAVLKEQHLARQLGGTLYDIVCKFEAAS